MSSVPAISARAPDPRAPCAALYFGESGPYHCERCLGAVGGACPTMRGHGGELLKDGWRAEEEWFEYYRRRRRWGKRIAWFLLKWGL